MLQRTLRPSTRRRRLLRLILLATLLLASTGVRPLFAQASSSVETDTAARYGWVTAGLGRGNTGVGLTLSGGTPVAAPVFVGARYTWTTEIALFASPAPTTWDGGPLLGLVRHGRYGHVSIASGLTLVGGTRRDGPAGTRSDPCVFCTTEYESERYTTVGLPIDVQAVFTPIRYVGIGVRGFVNVNPRENLLGGAIELHVRFPH